jgi:hypothetical protein
VGLKFSKCLNQICICIFKGFGVILLHFKVEKFNQGVILQQTKRGAPGRVTGTTPIFLFGLVKYYWIEARPGCAIL